MPERRAQCVVIGAGGHALVLLDALALAGAVEVKGLLDANRSLWGSRVLGHPVLGGDELLAGLSAQGVDSFLVGLGSTRVEPRRRALYEAGARAGLRALTLVHPAAVVSSSASLGAGSALLAGAIVNAAARVGQNAIINSGALVEHGARVGDHVHVASRAVILGDAQIGEAAFIGAGAIVKQGISVGAGALVGAGAVVLEDVPPGARVAGVPATGIGK